MKLLSLPIDCLIVLLNTKFTLQQLIPLRGLCQHFKSLIESRRCLGRKRSLKLFWKFFSIEQFTSDVFEFNLECPQFKLHNAGEDDDLILNPLKFAESTCDFLGELLPNVRHLIIYFGDKPYYTDEQFSFSSVLKLLSTWPHIDGLSIFGNFSRLIHMSENYNTDTTKQIWASINNLNCLKWFDLVFGVDLWSVNVQRNVGVDFSVELDKILPQLERLYISDGVHNLAQDVLRHLTSNCKELYLDYFKLPKGDLWKALNSHTTFTNITHLRLCQEFERISQIANHFSQLTYLDITLPIEDFPLPDILTAVNSLHYLTELKLYSFRFDILTDDNFQLYHLPTLCQITKLTIYVMKHDSVDADIFFRAINHAFPNIEYFTLKATFIFYDKNGNIFSSSRHLNQFRKLKKFYFLLFPRLREIDHYLFSAHHLERHQTTRYVRLKTFGQLEKNHTGWQSWSRTSDSQWSISMAHMIKQTKFL